MTAGDRIKIRRKELHLTVDDLAKRIKKNRATVYRYENGDIENMPVSVIEPLAAALETTPAYIAGWTETKDIEQQDAAQEASKNKAIPKGFVPMPAMSTVPLIGTIACGTPILAEQNVEMYISVPSMWRADFALMCKGDSMSPTIQDGDLVCIRSQITAANGQITAVLIDDEATLKRFYRHGDTVILHPENPRFTPMTYTKEEINDLRIEGVAVGICRGLPEYNTEV